MKLWRNVGLTLEMIKREHSVFALPFALTARSLVGFRVASCMATFLDCRLDRARAFRRNGFNRCADAEPDARNPRTKTRALPACYLSKGFCRWFRPHSLFAFPGCSLPTQPAYLVARALRTCLDLSLFLHQAVYTVVAPRLWGSSWISAVSRVDRDPQRP
jgi:hypothetical protein